MQQCFGYERHDNPEVVELINVLVKGAYGQLLSLLSTPVSSWSASNAKKYGSSGFTAP